jgi:hypothetical protein
MLPWAVEHAHREALAMRRLPFTLLFVVVGAGCGGNTEGRQPVSGTITLKGVPLDEGLIEFVPQEGEKVGTRGGAAIKNGKYSIPRDQGLLPGTYRVVISAADKPLPDQGAGVPPGPTRSAPGKNRIPAEYNRATKQVVTVTRGGPNRFNFTIP